MLHEYCEFMSELEGKDTHFDKLFERHSELGDQIRNAEERRNLLSDIEISNLKKEKLHIKDQLNQYLASYKE